MSTADKILLGYGVVTIGITPIGLTRGGSIFAVERGIRNIEADGDRGQVKGRVVIDTENAKLTVNALEMFTSADMEKYYPGLIETLGTVTSDLKIKSGDYNDVKWMGKTNDGEPVTITVKNALNIGNIEWTLEDKNEVVPSLEFTASYEESARDTPPWDVVFGV